MSHANGNGYHANGHAAERPRIIAFPEDRLPPHSILAERGVIGSVMLEPDVLHECGPLRPDHFYRDDHGTLWRTILALHAAGRPVDAIAVSEALLDAGEADALAMTAELADILNGTPHAANGPYYAGIVREHAAVRAQIAAHNAALKACYAREKTAAELAAESMTALDRLAADADPGGAVAADDSLDAAWAAIESRREGETDCLPTGLAEIDETFGGGLAPGRLIVVGARSSQGKSAFALGIAAHVAFDWSQPALYCSLEMPHSELSERLLSMRGRVPNDRLREPWRLTDGDRRRLAEAREGMRGGRLEIDDRSGRTLADIASAARRAKALRGLSLLVVDHVLLMAGTGGDDRRKDRREVLVEITRGFKDLARSLAIPVLMLCQLNRNSEKREDKRPFLSDFKESGSFEEDADQAVLLHRPEYYDPADSPGLALAIVAKNRGGRTGDVRLHFTGNQTRFGSWEDHEAAGIPANGAGAY